MGLFAGTFEIRRQSRDGRDLDGIISVEGGGMTSFTCGFCGRPCASFVWLGGVPYHEECTRGPGYQPRTYGTGYGLGPPSQGCIPIPTMTEERVRKIVREEIERLKDQIEGGLGVRP